MSFTPLENAEIQSIANEFLAKHRPPVEIRNKLDLAFRINGQSIELFEIRPRFQHPNEKIESNFAKVTFVRKQNIWKVFWRRADLKWHGYPPKPKVKTLKQFFKLVDEDKYHCFWG
ncbi:MAG: DUF3024 domain-containing protein [Nitrososphaerales archaeon]